MRFASSVADEGAAGDQIRVTDGLDEENWSSFVGSHPDANVFHTPEMSWVFDRAAHHRPSVWAATDPSGRPQALLTSVDVTLFDGPLRWLTSRTIAYGGMLWGHDPLGRVAARELLSAYRRATGGRVLFTELRHLSDASGVRDAFSEVGFRHEDHLNYLIDLRRPEEELWARLSKTAQQRIRSGLGKGVAVEEIVDEAGFERAHPMLEDVYRRVGVPIADPSLFRAALSILQPVGMLRIFAARLDDHLIGTRYLLTHRDRIVDWYSGMDRAFATYSPNEALVWHVLKWGREHGFSVFDFGGAGRPDEPYGPREFKAKFGGELVNFGRDVLVHAPVRLRLSRTGYALARRFLWRRAGEGVGR